MKVYKGLSRDAAGVDNLTLNRIPVKLTVKIPAAVLPTKNRKIYCNDNDNRYFVYLKKQDGANRKNITGKKRKIEVNIMTTVRWLRGKP